MKTIRPLATIAYDENILNEIFEYYSDQFVFWAYIKHKGEGEGLSEKKDHFHVFVQMADKTNPVKLKALFESHDGRPTTLNWRFSEFQPWFYYVIHDIDYLSSKGIFRQYHYDITDIVCSDRLELDAYLQECGVPECSRLRQSLLNDVSLRDMYLNGLLKPSNANGIKIISEMLRNDNIKGECRKEVKDAD